MNLSQNFFVGIIARQQSIKPELDLELRRRLEHGFGPMADYWGPTTAKWIAPESYRLEMGERLETGIAVFAHEVVIDDFIAIKQQTMEIERYFSSNGRRKFNLNPGFVCETGMYLISHKPSKLRWRIPASPYWVEQQFKVFQGDLVPLPNAFDEYSTPKRCERLQQLLERTRRKVA